MLAVIETLGVGGAEYALLDVLRALRNRGHLCEVAALYPPYTLEADFEASEVAVHRLDLGHRWYVPAAIWRLGRIVRRMRPDIVHAHLFFAGVYVAMTSILERRSKRFVTFHNLGYDTYPADTRWLKLRKALDGVAMRRGMDRRLAVSRAVAEHYKAHLGLTQVTVIPNGLDLKHLALHPRRDRNEVRARYGVGADQALLLLPGTLRKEKGHRFLLEALARLAADGITPRVLFAGDGPLETELRALRSRLELDEQALFLGQLRHPELLDLMASVDLVVMPSLHEGAPVAAGEAIALGTPLLASAVGGLAELSPQAGVRLIKPADSDHLAAEIARALEQEGNSVPTSDAGRLVPEATLGTLNVCESARQMEEEYSAALRSGQL